MILVPPDITSVYIEPSEDIHEGDNVTLICKAGGLPKPNVKWMREDGQNILQYQHNKIKQGKKQKLQRQFISDFTVNYKDISQYYL